MKFSGWDSERIYIILGVERDNIQQGIGEIKTFADINSFACRKLIK